MDNKELCKWLRENSSGIYRPAADAADVIEQLEKELEKMKLSEMRLKNIFILMRMGAMVKDIKMSFDEFKLSLDKVN